MRAGTINAAYHAAANAAPTAASILVWANLAVGVIRTERDDAP